MDEKTALTGRRIERQKIAFIKKHRHECGKKSSEEACEQKLLLDHSREIGKLAYAEAYPAHKVAKLLQAFNDVKKQYLKMLQAKKIDP